MFNRKPADTTHQLDDAIDEAISALAGLPDGDEKHTNAVNSLKALMEIRSADLLARKRKTPSPDAVIASCAQLVTVISILGFEKANVITSKSMSFVPRARIE